MKQYTMYVCETCGHETRHFDEMEEHEAGHLGLTVKELHSYSALKSFARYMGGVLSHTSNDETRGKFDKAVEDLIAFEEEHNLRQ